MLASPVGHYLPAASPVHRLDARVKVVCLTCLLVSTFAVGSPLQLALAAALVGALVAATRLPVRPVLATVRPIVPFALVIAVFNLFAMRGGDALLELGPLAVTTHGLWAAALYALRLLIAVTVGAVLLLTTTPTALTDAFESLLSPLARLGVPAHEVAMVLSLALRFVPVLADETQSVMDAQAARGGSFDEGGPAARVRALGAVLVPVFAGALRHAQNLSRALDARCYEGGEGRTRYHVPHVRPADVAFAAACLAWVAALVGMHVAGL